MINITTSQLEFYQNKIYKLEMDLIVVQEQLIAAKQYNSDQYKLKYQILLQKVTEESHLKDSRKNQSLLLQEKNTRQLNQKWENMLLMKSNDFNTQMESLKMERNKLKNKIVELQMKNITLQREIDQGDIQVLNIKLDSLKKENQRLKKDSNLLYEERESFNEKMERQLSEKEEEIKERQKSFYRQTIENLQLEIKNINEILQQQREKVSPNRQAAIKDLIKQKADLQKNQNQQLQKYVLLLQKSRKEQVELREVMNNKQKQYIFNLKEANLKIKSVQSELFQRKHNEEMRLINLRNQMSQKRQNQALDFKKELEKIEKEFNNERQHNKTIVKQFQDDYTKVKRQWQTQKAKYMQEKNGLKDKIAELRQRIKAKEDQANQETEKAVKSLIDLGNNEKQFGTYESTITFMSRQIKKSVIKLQQKDRQINNLLEQLKNTQNDSQKQIHDIRQKSKRQIKKLYEKIIKQQEQVDEMYQQLRDEKKKSKQLQDDLHYEKEGRYIQIDNLKKIIQEMERDYERLTCNKKNLEDSFREERQNVISTKIDINQQKKKKWVEIQRQKTSIQILYRERQIKFKKQFDMKIQKLKAQKQKHAQQKQKYRAETQSLRQMLNLPNNENKQNRLQDYQKKLATLDLQIALTQNLFQTLSNATAQKNYERDNNSSSEMHEKMYGQNSIFDEKQSDILTPYQGGHLNEQVYKDAAFSFIPHFYANPPANKNSK